METQKRTKTIRKTYDMTPEFWEELQQELKISSENFTVHVTRLIRENIERRKLKTK